MRIEPAHFMSSNEVSHRVRFGPYEADLRTHELWKHGTRLKLSGQPFQILEVLLSRPGELISRDELREKLWPQDTFVDFSHGLNAAVNKLRDALSDSADDPKYIETLPRRGYRFIGQIERAFAEGSLPAAIPSETAVQATAPESVQEVVTPLSVPIPVARSHRRPGALGVVSIVLGILVVVGAYTLISTPFVRRNAASGAPPRTESIVNVPDAVSDPALSPDGNQIAYFRKGQTPSTAGIFVKEIGSDTIVQLTHTPADCCPVWSPDGKSIAFSRAAGEASAIYIVPASGGEERKLVSTGPGSSARSLDWSPDGKSLVLSGISPEGEEGMFLISLDTLQWRKLTDPPAGAHDGYAAFSPDGQTLCFVRSQPTGFPDELYLMNLVNLVTHPLTSEHAHIIGPPAWSADGASVVYATTKQGSPSLWRVTVATGASALIIDAGGNVWHPTTSRRGFRLAFEQIRSASSIESLDASHPESGSRSVVTSTTGRNEGPQVSPDGRRIVFMSDRSGSMEIWVANADGSDPVQLTALGSAGTPRWSPDSKQIVFDSRQNSRGAIYTVSADGGEAHPLVRGDNENLVPSFSRDGRSIFFASDRGGEWNVWRIPVAGGNPVRVTTEGGFGPIEAADGYIYYSTTMYPNPEIWRIRGDGTEATRLAPRLVPRMWATWAVAPSGIYLVEDAPDGNAALEFYDIEHQSLRRVAALKKAPFWLAVSSDGSHVLMDHANEEESTIVMMRNFR